MLHVTFPTIPFGKLETEYIDENRLVFFAGNLHASNNCFCVLDPSLCHSRLRRKKAFVYFPLVLVVDVQAK